MFSSASIGVHPSAVLRTMSAVERLFSVLDRGLRTDFRWTGRWCKTNPVSPLRISDRGLQIGGRLGGHPTHEEPRGDCAKRTQFGPASQKAGPLGARNAKRTQFGWSAAASEGEMCETNPICRCAQEWARGGKSSCRFHRARLRRTKPISPARTGPEALSCKTNPIPRLRMADGVLGQTCGGDAAPCRLRPAEGKMRKTNPILEGTRVQDQRPDTRPLPLAFRAKRTQFRPSRRSRYPSIPLFYHSTIPAQCQLCKTNPICQDPSRKTKPITGGGALQTRRFGLIPAAGQIPLSAVPCATLSWKYLIMKRHEILHDAAFAWLAKQSRPSDRTRKESP